VIYYKKYRDENIEFV